MHIKSTTTSTSSFCQKIDIIAGRSNQYKSIFYSAQWALETCLRNKNGFYFYPLLEMEWKYKKNVLRVENGSKRVELVMADYRVGGVTAVWVWLYYWLVEGASSSAWSLISCLLRFIRSVVLRRYKLNSLCSSPAIATTCKTFLN